MVDEAYKHELAEFDAVEAGLSSLAKKASELPSVDTENGYKEHKALAKDLQKRRTSLDKLRKDITKPHRDFISEVNDRGNGIIDRLKTIEEPVKSRVKEVDEREERERQQRHKELREKIQANITDLEYQAAGANSGVIAEFLESAERLDMTGYYDLSKEALDEQARVTQALQRQFDATVEREAVSAEREKLQKEREELEALKRERAAQQQEEPVTHGFDSDEDLASAIKDYAADAAANVTSDTGNQETIDVSEASAIHICTLLVDAFDSGELGCSSPYLEHIVGLARQHKES